MDNINNKFEMEGNHEGFEDIMLKASEDYPEDCFNPQEYFHLNGYFRFHNEPEPIWEPNPLLEKANKKYEARQFGKGNRRKFKPDAVAIYREPTHLELFFNWLKGASLSWQSQEQRS